MAKTIRNEYEKALSYESLMKAHMQSRKGKRRLKKKVKSLKTKVECGEITSKEAKLYLAGHLGYIKIANVKNLKDKLFA